MSKHVFSKAKNLLDSLNEVPCDYCEGKGYFVVYCGPKDYDEPCYVCEATGKVQIDRDNKC